jgi:hypothetical protein
VKLNVSATIIREREILLRIFYRFRCTH